MKTKNKNANQTHPKSNTRELKSKKVVIQLNYQNMWKKIVMPKIK